ncbi:phosphoribosylanthranilate isomerase [Halodesulfurarchaeum sp. HSR-GB]|uniref:phosphoribosylanthranilate isomerase n=1 Tax=Halodesulfurarchaeum sp. HSR-GB TaxID=3074077 RepID=UPI0028584DC1|nr:phosphoribosylanthranilate isomerase [Halodesulfurarchaeum sp. HSR-GB]MDR5655704.1 phosphoribosylanthranilate isomerase [Halodesulfurarchaeum sp. HSR-GB]
MVRVKLCGFTRQVDVTRAVEAGVDAVGAIVDVPVETPRAVDGEHAARLFAAVPPFVSTVLVTMPESVDRARELIDRVDPDAIQVHAGLAPAEVEALADETPVIAAVGHDEPAVAAYADAADALLIDSTDESGAGGTGQTHDWTATRELTQLDTPVVLAGGLTPENVRSAVSTVDPYAVDAASGVEAEPGQKDGAAMDQFVAAARGRD